MAAPYCGDGIVELAFGEEYDDNSDRCQLCHFVIQ